MDSFDFSPPWNNADKFIHGESCMFVQGDKAATLFPIASIRRAWCPNTGIVYECGKDFSFSPGQKFIIRLPGSRIPLITGEKLFPRDENCIYYPEEGCNAVPGKINGGNIWFSAKDDYAKNQLELDYTAAEVDFFPENCHDVSDRLPRFRKLLESDDSLRITLLGDSISEGFNASAFIGVPPYQSCYAELVRCQLARRHPGELVFRNRAKDGTGTPYALQNILHEWKADVPDLLILACGMNDFSVMTAETFLENNLCLIRHAKEANPAVEVLMVVPMAGNPAWTFTKPGKDAEFAKIVRDYHSQSGTDFALADVRHVWMQMVGRKGFFPLTGNGVNHPNDFAHRVYASVILSALSP